MEEPHRAAIAREAAKSVKLDRGPFRRLSCRMHSFTYRLTGGRVGGVLDSASGVRPILLLTTTGRRTGRSRTTPLVYLDGGEGTFVVAGSNAGRDEDPGWVHNLRAEPTATVRIARRDVPVHAIELDSAEAAALWPALRAMNAQYAEYAKLTRRTVPVFRLSRAV